MISLHTITSLDGPGLQPYRTLRRPLEHQQQGIFVAEGEKVVHRLLASDLAVLSVLLTPQWLSQYRDLLEQRDGRTDVFVAEKKLVEKIVGYNLHQGIMAVGKIPHPASLDNILARQPRPYVLAAVDGLTNAENLGVLVRNCAGFGVQALLVGETSSSPYLRRAVRNSMGAVFTLPVVQTANLAETLATLRARFGVRVVAAHPQPHGTVLHKAELNADCCIVFGSEGEGISQTVLKACDERVAIPMQHGVDSLNVATASAVFFYELVRQRQGS
ncbi:MAG: TrmH family RNA methyltransferase [Bacteroidota bacterium]